MTDYSEECCFNYPRDYCRGAGCACGCHIQDAINSASVNYRTRDWNKQTKDGIVATHVIRIPELGNAELKLTVDIERIHTTLGQAESLADAPAALPGFAQLRPVRVDIHLGGEHVYHWERDTVEMEPPSAALVVPGGAAPAKRR